MLLEIGAVLTSIVGGVLLLKNSSAKKEEELNAQIATMQTEHEQELEQKEEEKQQAVDEAVIEEKQRQDEVFEQKEQDKADEQMSVDPRSGSLYFGDKSLTEDGKAFAVDYDPFYDYTDNDLQIDSTYLKGSTTAYSSAAYAMRCRFVSPYMLVSDLKSTPLTTNGGPVVKVIGDMRDGKYSGLMPVVTNEQGTARRALFGAWREYGFMLEVFNPYDCSMPLYKMVLSKIKIGGETVNVLGGCTNNGYYHDGSCTTDAKGNNSCGANHVKGYGNGNCDYASSAMYQFGSSLGWAFITGDRTTHNANDGRSGLFYTPKVDTGLDKLEYEISFGQAVQIPAKSSKLFFIQIPLCKVENNLVLLKDFQWSKSKSTAAEAVCECNNNWLQYRYTSNPSKFDLTKAVNLYDTNLANKKVGRKTINRGNYGRCATLYLSLFDWDVDGHDVSGFIVNQMSDPGIPNEKTMEFYVTLCSSDSVYTSAGSMKTSNGWGGGGNDQFKGNADVQRADLSTSTHRVVISNSAEIAKKQGSDYTQGFVTNNVASYAFDTPWDEGSNIHMIAHTEDGATTGAEVLSLIAMDCGDEELDYVVYDDNNILSDERYNQYVNKNK